MDYKVVYAAQIGRDLETVVPFLAQHSPTAAARLGHALLDTADALAFFPYRGPIMKGRPHLRRLSHPPHHVIIYRVNEVNRSVEILRFWDCRQNPEHLHLP